MRTIQYESRSRSLQKFNIIFAIIIFILFFIFGNFNILFSQNFREVNLFDQSSEVFEDEEKAEDHCCISQLSGNRLKVELNNEGSASVIIYDITNKPVRTYQYNKITEGTFFIDLNSGNLTKGYYLCVLNAGKENDKVKLKIE